MSRRKSPISGLRSGLPVGGCPAGRTFRTVRVAVPDFTPTQGRYLAYIHAYTCLHGYPPAESEIAAAMCVSPPAVNTMVKMLEKKGLILRQPGQPRSIRILIPEDQIPPWNRRKPAHNPATATVPQAASPATPAAPPANLYVLSVFLMSGPISEKAVGKMVLRVLEIRGDQTLAQLHDAIFQGFDRDEQHLYEFHLGKRPFDPAGPNYGIPEGAAGEKEPRDARTTKLDDLGLKAGRAFGYLFDFGDEWYHQVQVDRIEKAIPTVPYPRLLKRVGKSPPQYLDE